MVVGCGEFLAVGAGEEYAGGGRQLVQPGRHPAVGDPLDADAQFGVARGERGGAGTTAVPRGRLFRPVRAPAPDATRYPAEQLGPHQP